VRDSCRQASRLKNI